MRWLGEPDAVAEPGGPSGISQALTRLGAAPLEALYRAVVQPVATRETLGAWYPDLRVMSLDGADTAANREAFGQPASAHGVNASGAFP